MPAISRRRSLTIAAMAMAIAGFSVADRAAASEQAALARGFIEKAAAEVRAEAPAVKAAGSARSGFASLFDRNFHLDSLVQAVIGGRWAALTPAAQGEFRRAFESYLVKAYAERFYAYAGRPMTVVATEPAASGAVLVRTMVEMPEGSSVPVDWQVGRFGPDQRITDVVIDGVSLTRTQRDEFASVIRANGGDVGKLTAMLNQRSQ